MMKSKNKPSRNPCEQSLLITPLSVDDCISKIEDLANVDLKVTIKHQSKYKAEINFVQRRDYDHPIYTTSRLIATKNGTCVTFDGGKSLTTNKAIQLYVEMLLIWVSRLALGAALIVMVVMIIKDPLITPLWFCILFLIYGLYTAKESSYPNRQDGNFDSKYMTESMLERSANLKASLYDALYVDPSEVRWDELGNEYYVDTNTYHEGRVKGT